jgi:MHS family proline/betaine transporter-like MFS transporter
VIDTGSRPRLVAAGVIGNVLEWYDFAIYGYFAISIGHTFFPQGDRVAQVLSAFGVFAVGYLMRPLGGMVTGVIGDRYGRRTAFTVSVTAMAVPTFLVGLLPGYQTLGVAAPILLTLLRMVQGLSVGGECSTSFIFLIENSPPGRRGLMGAVATCGITLGTLCGSGAGAVMASALSPDDLHDWGWRVPFTLGLLVGVVGYILRRHIQETAPPPSGGRSPLAALRDNRRLLLRLAAVPTFSAIGFNLMFLYIVSWLQFVDDVAPARALDINTISMSAMIPVMLSAGWLSDRIGRKPPLIAALVLGFAGAIPLLWLMHHTNPVLIFVGQLGFAAVLGTAIAIFPSLMVEATPPAIRCTAIAIGFNLSYGMMGGLSPLSAAWLVHRTDTDLSPAFMVMVAAVVSFATLLTFAESRPVFAAAAAKPASAGDG